MKDLAYIQKWLNANPWRVSVFVFIVPFFVSAVAMLIGFDKLGKTQFMTDLIFGLLAALIAYFHHKQVANQKQKNAV